jgi:hypothetical protein
MFVVMFAQVVTSCLLFFQTIGPAVAQVLGEPPPHIAAPIPVFTPPTVIVAPGSVTSPEQCGGGIAVRATMGKGVPAAVGRELYSTWYVAGAAQVGCPNGVPREVGDMYLESLEGGLSSPSVDVGRAGGAVLVYSELTPWLYAHVEQIETVLPRESFGFGDMQAIQTTNGCQLFTRRFSDSGGYLQLPLSAVPTVALEAIDHRAVPFLTAPVTVGGGLTMILNIGFLRAAPGGGGALLYKPREFVVQSVRPTLTCGQLMPGLSSAAASLSRVVDALGLATPVAVAPA